MKNIRNVLKEYSEGLASKDFNDVGVGTHYDFADMLYDTLQGSSKILDNKKLHGLVTNHKDTYGIKGLVQYDVKTNKYIVGSLLQDDDGLCEIVKAKDLHINLTQTLTLPVVAEKTIFDEISEVEEELDRAKNDFDTTTKSISKKIASLNLVISGGGK